MESGVHPTGGNERIRCEHSERAEAHPLSRPESAANVPGNMGTTNSVAWEGGRGWSALSVDSPPGCRFPKPSASRLRSAQTWCRSTRSIHQRWRSRRSLDLNRERHGYRCHGLLRLHRTGRWSPDRTGGLGGRSSALRTEPRTRRVDASGMQSARTLLRNRSRGG